MAVLKGTFKYTHLQVATGIQQFVCFFFQLEHEWILK